MLLCRQMIEEGTTVIGGINHPEVCLYPLNNTLNLGLPLDTFLNARFKTSKYTHKVC